MRPGGVSYHRMYPNICNTFLSSEFGHNNEDGLQVVNHPSMQRSNYRLPLVDAEVTKDGDNIWSHFL